MRKEQNWVEVGNIKGHQKIELRIIPTFNFTSHYSLFLVLSSHFFPFHSSFSRFFFLYPFLPLRSIILIHLHHQHSTKRKARIPKTSLHQKSASLLTTLFLCVVGTVNNVLFSLLSLFCPKPCPLLKEISKTVSVNRRARCNRSREGGAAHVDTSA